MQVDGCIELPLSELQSTLPDRDSIAKSTTHTKCGWVAPLVMVGGGYQSLSIRCADPLLDPSPHMRVQISRALVGHAICTGPSPSSSSVGAIAATIC